MMNAQSTPGSISDLLDRMKEGDDKAVELLWQRYFPRLVSLARRKLQGIPQRVADGEDAALNAFDSFCRRAASGDFPDLKDRDSLWTLLVVLTARKVADLIKHSNRQKRGGGNVRGDSALIPNFGSADPVGFDGLPDTEPSAEEAAILAEEVHSLLAKLPDANFRQVAVWKLEGFTNAEIADRHGCSVPTVERRLAVIRRILKPS